MPVKTVTPENRSQPGRFRTRNGKLPPPVHLQLLGILLPPLLFKLPVQWMPHIPSACAGRLDSLFKLASACAEGKEILLVAISHPCGQWQRSSWTSPLHELANSGLEQIIPAAFMFCALQDPQWWWQSRKIFENSGKSLRICFVGTQPGQTE